MYDNIIMIYYGNTYLLIFFSCLPCTNRYDSEKVALRPKSLKK